MTELTAEKWEELNTKLEAEATRAEEARAFASMKAQRFMFAALVLIVVAVTVPIAFMEYWFAGVAAVPPALGFVVCIGLLLRHRRTVTQANADIERLREDIRQWKRKRPK